MTTYPLSATVPADPALALAPELPEPLEIIERDDLVYVTPFVAPSNKPGFYGVVEVVNVEVQYALVRKVISGMLEWFSVSELCLVLKSSALEEDTKTAE